MSIFCLLIAVCLLAFVSQADALRSASTSRRFMGTRTQVLMMVKKDISMPALSSTMKEGRIVSWGKKVGDKVSAGDVLLVVESDKTDMNVESVEDGYLGAIYTPEGGTAAVGAVVATVVDSMSEMAGGSANTPAPVATTMPRVHKSKVTTGPAVTWKPISKLCPPEHDDSVSPDFFVYPQGTISYDDLRRSMPERFDLSILDSVFASWSTSWDWFTIQSEYALENQNAFISVDLEHDHHVYRSDASVTHFFRDKKRERMLTIKLPKNGFIFPSPLELNVFESAKYRHRPSTFLKLDAVHVAQFPRMIDFAKSYLSSASVSSKMFYNFSNDVFEFKVYNTRGGADGVCFSFHHMDNLDHEFDEDYWLDA